MGLVQFDAASGLGTIASFSFPIRMEGGTALILAGNTRIEALSFATRERLLQRARERGFPPEILIREIAQAAITREGSDEADLVDVVALAMAGAEDPQIMRPDLLSTLQWHIGLDADAIKRLPAFEVDALIRDHHPQAEASWISIRFQTDAHLPLADVLRHFVDQLLECARLFPNPSVPHHEELPRANPQQLLPPKPPIADSKALAAMGAPSNLLNDSPASFPALEPPDSKEPETLLRETPLSSVRSEPDFSGIAARMVQEESSPPPKLRSHTSQKIRQPLHSFSYRVFPTLEDPAGPKSAISKAAFLPTTPRSPAIALPPPQTRPSPKAANPSQPAQDVPGQAPSAQAGGLKPRSHQESQAAEGSFAARPRPAFHADSLGETQTLAKPTSKPAERTRPSQGQAQEWDAEALADAFAQLLELESDLRGILP